MCVCVHVCMCAGTKQEPSRGMAKAIWAHCDRSSERLVKSPGYQQALSIRWRHANFNECAVPLVVSLLAYPCAHVCMCVCVHVCMHVSRSRGGAKQAASRSQAGTKHEPSRNRADAQQEPSRSQAGELQKQFGLTVKGLVRG